MGDRCLVVVTDGTEISPAIYTHWAGYQAPDILVKAGADGLIRKDDVSYASARICGAFHEALKDSGALSLGLIAPPSALDSDTLRKFSHGDAGVILVNVSDGSLGYFGSYHQTQKPSDWNEEEEFTAAPTSIVLADK